jgi:hypothetical protein
MQHFTSELDRLGDEIAELSAHLDAATARLLALIREFDARGGWNTGFRSCAAWLSWRVGLDLGAARERVRVARGPDGALRFRRPDGRPLPEVPPPAAVLGDPIKVLRACHDSNGLRLDARTACAGWLGERLDLTWAIDVLHPLAQRARPSRGNGVSQAYAPTWRRACRCDSGA